MPAATRRRAPENLDDLKRQIHDDFFAATESLYYINPRAGSAGEQDPEDDGLSGESTTAPDDAGGGLRRFQMWSEQRHMAAILLEQRRRRQPMRAIKLKCRQSGDSTFAAIFNFHHWYWRPRQNAIVVAHHDSTTSKLFQMNQTLYEELPPELQVPPKKLNRKELAFEPPHGGSLIAQTAGYLDIGHGLTISYAHLSEIDRWADPETALEGLMETIPDAPGTSILIESVAQGADGWMHTFWKASKAGKTLFVPIFTAWYMVPEYRTPVDPDYAFTPEDREWMKQFKLTGEQVMWYRNKQKNVIARDPWGGERRMKTLYPFTDDEAFQSSGMCVFPDVVLNAQQAHVQPPRDVYRLVATGEGNYEAVPADRVEGDFLVWEDPEPGAFYSHGVDISDGVGKSESVVSIWKYPGYIQVAEWANNRSSVDETAFVARWLAELYGASNALVVPEINKAGPLLLYILQTLPGTYGIFRWRYLDKPGQQMTEQPKLGWETNSATKRVLAQVANLLFIRGVQGTGEGICRSDELVAQMRRCVDILPNVRWRAVSGYSDRIIAALIAITGAYLEFEGGSVNLAGPINPLAGKLKQPKWRDPGTYDSADDIFDRVMAPHDPTRPEWDFEIR